MYEELKKLAEAFPADLDWDSNTEPFFNGPSGESLGGGATGFYSVYGKPFRLEGEDYDYDGPTYVEACNADFAKFMVAARDGVLAMIAENEELKHKLSAGHAREFDLRSQVRDANEYREKVIKANATLRQEAYRYRWIRHGAMVILNKEVCFTAESGAKIYSTMPSQRELDSAIDAAMSKEAIHEKP